MYSLDFVFSDITNKAKVIDFKMTRVLFFYRKTLYSLSHYLGQSRIDTISE